MIGGILIGLLAFVLGFDAGVESGRKDRSRHTEDEE